MTSATPPAIGLTEELKPCMCADPENCREIPEGWEQRCKRMNAPPTDGVVVPREVAEIALTVLDARRGAAGAITDAVHELKRALSAGAK